MYAHQLTGAGFFSEEFLKITRRVQFTQRQELRFLLPAGLPPSRKSQSQLTYIRKQRESLELDAAAAAAVGWQRLFTG